MGDNGGGGGGSVGQAAHHHPAGGFKVEKSDEQQGAPGQGLNLGERWFKPSTSLRSKLLQAPTPLDGDDKARRWLRRPASASWRRRRRGRRRGRTSSRSRG